MPGDSIGLLDISVMATILNVKACELIEEFQKYHEKLERQFTIQTIRDSTLL